VNFIYHVCVELIVAGMVVSVGVCVCAEDADTLDQNISTGLCPSSNMVRGNST